MQADGRPRASGSPGSRERSLCANAALLVRHTAQLQEFRREQPVSPCGDAPPRPP